MIRTSLTALAILALVACTVSAQTTGYSDTLFGFSGTVEDDGRYLLTLELRPGTKGLDFFDGLLVYAEPSHTLLVRHWQSSKPKYQAKVEPLAGMIVDGPAEGNFSYRFPVDLKGEDGFSVGLVTDGEVQEFTRAYVTLESFRLSFEFQPGEGPADLWPRRVCCECSGPSGSCSECDEGCPGMSPSCSCPGCVLEC